MAFWYRLRHLKHHMSRYFLMSIVVLTHFGWIPKIILVKAASRLPC